METNDVDEMNSANSMNLVEGEIGSEEVNGANGLSGVGNVNVSNGINKKNGPIITNGIRDENAGNDDATASDLYGLKSVNGVNLVNGNIDQSKHHSDPLTFTNSLLVYDLFKKLQGIIHDRKVKVNGKSLEIPTVVAFSRYSILVTE